MAVIFFSSGLLGFGASQGEMGLAANHDKFLGNVMTARQDELFHLYWNQITPEDAGKWGSVEAQRDVMVWGVLDRIFDYAREHNIPVKQHALVYGDQAPRWVADLPPEEQRQEVDEWMHLFSERYPDVEMIDVVNEPLHTPLSFKDAIGGDGETGWDWVIWSFERAREYFPDSILLINEYGILCCAANTERYIEVIELLQERGLIDGIGVQAHGLEWAEAGTIQANLDRLAELGLPIYVSELDLEAGDDEAQLAHYQRVFPVLWEHEAVAGVTLWGYRAGQIWKRNAYLLDWFDEERPALVWLRDYLASADEAADEDEEAGLLPYRNPELSVAERADDLLSRMTLEEKVGQMTQINVTRLMGQGEWDRGALNEDWLWRVLAEAQVGSLLSGGGSAPVPNTPRAWAEMTNELQRYALTHSRLGIPVIYGVDAVHGHNNVRGATIYPHNLGLAASWSPELVRRLSERTAGDMLATGTHWNFAPVADLGRDPRWGRFYETFGEDPLLASSLVAAAVEGLQEAGVAASVKHFIGYSQPLTGQDRSPAFVDERSFRELHLPPFIAGIEAGTLTIMANSGALNGVAVHASPYLLTGLLRGELGFTGVVVSDWHDIMRLYTVHRVAPSYEDAIALSINAGVDMYMVPHDATGFTSRLIELVEAGQVSEKRIDEAVRRILTLKLELGLFENPYVDAERAQEIIEDERALALEAALASMTLLKNNGVLPLEDVRSILVTGPGADNVAWQMGGWTIGWQGIPSELEVPPAVTVYEGLRDLAPEGTEVRYLGQYENAAMLQEAVAEADVVVVVVGEGPYAEGEGDSETLALSSWQETLLGRLADMDVPVVTVMLAGRPLIITDLLDGMDALLMAYLPGSEAGTAVADVLFGEHNPGGRLPFSWPQQVGQVPISYDQAVSDRMPEPLFEFGYGLSYTSVAYAGLELEAANAAVAVTLELSNTGERGAYEVVQVYAQPAWSPVLLRERLVAFERVWLEPGETQTVSLQVPLVRLEVLPGDVFTLGEPELVPTVYTFRVADERIRLELP